MKKLSESQMEAALGARSLLVSQFGIFSWWKVFGTILILGLGAQAEV
jgi:hypothetical protein